VISIRNQKKYIKKCISNCLQTEKKINWKGRGKLDHIGNNDYKYVVNLLDEQEYKCHKCNDKVLTYKYKPYCLYKFSIDRLNNENPHDKIDIKYHVIIVTIETIFCMVNKIKKNVLTVIVFVMTCYFDRN